MLSFILDYTWVADTLFRETLAASELDSSIKVTPFLCVNQQKDTILFNPGQQKITIVVASFIACLPCRQLEPVVEKIYEQYQNNPNVKLVKFNPIDPVDEMVQYTARTRETPYPYPILHPFTRADFANRFGVDIYPCTFILNHEGRVIYKFWGYEVNYEKHFISEITKTVQKELQPSQLVSRK